MREWYDDFKTYFHIIAVIIVLAITYFILTIDWGSGDTSPLNPVRSATNVFYQGSQHNLASIVNNIDLLEDRIIRIQLGRHEEETLFTITPYGNIVPLEEGLEDNRLVLEMTLSTSIFLATPIFNQRDLLIGVYLEEVGYGMFLERWLLTGEYS
ncbi:MAG: hypothetical protein FWE27_04860 [Defluviitaleaceae bacterium]|nr:hypothetical protein [Defluviitaleaceae bacterium]